MLPDDRVEVAVWSPDSRRVLVTGAEARIWDVVTGTEVAVLEGMADNIHSGAWSPDGQHVLLADDKGMLRLYPASGGAGRVLEQLDAVVVCMTAN